MTIATRLSAALMIVGLSACVTTGRVRSGYDRFTQSHNTVMADMMVRTAGLNNLIISAVAVEKAGAKSPIRLTVATLSVTPSHWPMADCHNLDFLANGAPVALSSEKYDNQIQRNVIDTYYWERVHVDVDEAEFEKMANAESVEGRLCNTEFALSREQIEQMRAFLQQRNAKKSAPSPSLPSSAAATSNVD